MIGRRPFDPNAFPMPVSVAPQTMTAPLTGAFDALPQASVKAPPKHNWVGILADALSGIAGQAPMYGQMLARQKEEQSAFERGEEQYQRRRADNLNDQMALLSYKRSLPPDDALTQALDAAGITDPAERQRYYRQKADAMTAPPMMSAAGVDEQGNPVMRFFPRAQALPPPAMPAPTVGTVKNGYRFKGGNPASPDAWEALGGPTQPASGNFR